MKTFNDPDKRYWTMSNVAIKHLWDKFGGIMIPNAFFRRIHWKSTKNRKIK